MDRDIETLKEHPHWSYSAFSTYLTCPMKYYFRYVAQAEVERTSVCLPFGRAFHAVLSEGALKGPGFTQEDAQENFAVFFQGETEVSENLVYKPDETFDVRIIDKENLFTIVLKSKGPLQNPIFKYADDEVMAIDKSHMRRAILSRVCKQINHKYMNGINCIYLNYSRDKQQ